MNENINLVEILKDAPNGTKLWSPICGECTLFKTSSEAIICSLYDNYIAFDNNGCFMNYPHAECVLFPSKDNRDWSTFKVPQKHKNFELGQKVLVPYNNGTVYKWRLAFYSHYDESIKHHMTTDAMCFPDEEVIAYKGNEDKLGKPVESNHRSQGNKHHGRV